MCVGVRNDSSPLTVRHFAALGWSAKASKAADPNVFSKYFFTDDNVLYLYTVQRGLLRPQVEEQVHLRGGLQCVDITWHVDGEPFRGTGEAGSKKAARREASRRLMRNIPVSASAVDQLRKQMLNGLRMRSGAEVVEDGPIFGTGGHRHRTVWKVPQDGARRTVEISADGSGESAFVAQARAWEGLYLEIEGLPLQPGAPKASASAPRVLKSAAVAVEVADATGLSSEAAGELTVRHNLIVQRGRIQARETCVVHASGYHCSLSWSWRDAQGALQERATTGLGRSKRAARAEAAKAMLVAEGHAVDLPHEALNEAARIRGLTKAGDAGAVSATCKFVQAWPADAWGLILSDVWQSVLARSDGDSIVRLGKVVAACLSGAELDARKGLAPTLWEDLLDTCAYVASRETARQGLIALDRLPVASSAFPSLAQCEYFKHFRRLIAWERVGMNQAAMAEITAMGNSQGIGLDKEQCLLPYLTLQASGESALQLSLSDIRAGDVVFIQACSPSSGTIVAEHLAVVTSISSPSGSSAAGGRAKLTVRCHTLGTADIDAESFRVHGLDSEVTAMRMIKALRSVTEVNVGSDEFGARRPSTFSPAVRSMVVDSFGGSDTRLATCLAEEPPTGCEEENEQAIVKRLAVATEAAATRGAPLTAAQAAAVRSALERRLTLIHGPPGTGKTTAAVCVVLAWRTLGDRILCVADSNVAADHLHASLESWGVRSLRFSFSEPAQLAGGTNSKAQPLGAATLPSGQRPSGRQGRAGATGGGTGAAGSNMYQRMLAMRDALADFQIVVTTCGSAGHDLLKDTRFPRVIVDECTQSVEPSTLVPLSLGCSHVVLIGDHRQLPPTVLTEEAKRGGLERSLFRRLVRDDHSTEDVDRTAASGFSIATPVLLDEQRRMHPSISAFPNLHFYSGLIRDAAPERPPVFGVPWPRGGDIRVLLVDVGAMVGEVRRGTSYHNSAEADAVLDLANLVLQGSPAGGAGGQPALPSEELAVITPYVQQRRALQASFAALSVASSKSGSLSLLRLPRVATIDGFQGAERDMVIFSAVRSNRDGRLGFLADDRRANVVLTRARRGLVVFADAATMREARGSVWANWLAWVEAHDAVMPLEVFRAACLQGPAPHVVPDSRCILG